MRCGKASNGPPVRVQSCRRVWCCGLVISSWVVDELTPSIPSAVIVETFPLYLQRSDPIRSKVALRLLASPWSMLVTEFVHFG
jgi:hypothetical protein